MSFSDSSQFQLDECGVMRHKRTGDTWVDRLMDGVDIDITMFLENCGYAYIEEEPGDEIVGERKITTDVQETTKDWDRPRGEKKFRRKKKIPQKKFKKYPTKPKPKHSWHKRLSKIAIELDMEPISSHIEQAAVQEIGDFYDEYLEEKRLIEQEKEDKYWESWIQKVEENPGNYGIVSVKILIDPDGVPVHDIDTGGVKRDLNPDPYNSPGVCSIVMDEWDKLPSFCAQGIMRYLYVPHMYPVIGHVWYDKEEISTHIPEGFSFQRYNFFTYWDEKNHMYIWKSMNKNSWQCGGWRDHFDYYPDINILEDIFSLDKQWLPWKEVGTLSKWINGIEWETVWSRMDEMRTGRSDPLRTWEGGDGFANRSRESHYYPMTQIPRMIIH